MNTDKHGSKKYFVVLIKTEYVVGRVSVFISENLWPFKKLFVIFVQFVVKKWVVLGGL